VIFLNRFSSGIEALTPVVMKSTISGDITPCSSLKVDLRFGRSYRLHLQIQRRSRTRNHHRSDAYSSNLKMEVIHSSGTSVHIPTTRRCHRRWQHS
jgi:hypothetical protein